jgi:parallel beta-helix repeat protein
MAIDLISVPTVTMEVADVIGGVVPAGGRTVESLGEHLLNNTPLNVRDFYELTDGADDVLSWQRAHDAAAGGAGGGRVFVPNRSTPYSFGSTLNVTAPNVTFEGDAWGSVVLPASATFNLITLGSAAHRTQFRRIWFQGAATDTTTTQHGIFTGALAAPDDVTVEGCLFGALTTAGGSLANAIKIDGGNRWKVHGCTVMNLQGADSNHGYGVLAGTTHYLSAHENHFVGAAGHGRHCVYLSGGCTWCNVGDNIAIGFTEEAFPMYARGAQAANTDNLVHDNQVFGGGQLTATGAALSVFGKALRNTIRGNKVYGYAGSGITINTSGEASGAADNNVVEFNDIYNVSWDGIELRGASNTSLRGNTAVDVSQASSGTYVGFRCGVETSATVATTNTRFLGGNEARGATLRGGVFIDAAVTGTEMGVEYFPDAQIARIITNGAAVRGGQFVKYGLHGISADNGDTSQTIQVGRDAVVERWATTFTVDHTVTLDLTNALDGSRFKIIRTGLGAHTLTVTPLVGGPSSRVIPNSTAAIIDVEYSTDLGGWVLTGYQPL